MKPTNYGQWVHPFDCDVGGSDSQEAGCSLIGSIVETADSICSLTGYLNRAPTLLGRLNINDCADGVPIYPGPYEVTPHSYEQTLNTANQLMLEDVTVHQIRYSETSNPSDGLTAYIGD